MMSSIPFESLNLSPLVRNVSISIAYLVHRMDSIHNRYRLDEDVEIRF